MYTMIIHIIYNITSHIFLFIFRSENLKIVGCHKAFVNFPAVFLVFTLQKTFSKEKRTFEQQLTHLDREYVDSDVTSNLTKSRDRSYPP